MVAAAVAAAKAGEGPRVEKHVIVYREAGRFAGWPANHGAWSWGEEIVLRDDGGNWDLGYTRTLQRPDGKLVTVYYYNTDKDSERFIAATIWDPGR